MIEYFLHIWGKEAKRLQKQLGLQSNYFYFKTEKERNDFLSELNKKKKCDLFYNIKDGAMTHKQTYVIAIFKCNNNNYKIIKNFGYEYPREGAIMMFVTGKYADSNVRKKLIQQHGYNFKFNNDTYIELISVKTKLLN